MYGFSFSLRSSDRPSLVRRRLSIRIPGWTMLLLLFVGVGGGCDRVGTPAPVRTKLPLRITLIAETKDDDAWQMLTDVAQAVEQEDQNLRIKLIAPALPSPRAQQGLVRGLIGTPIDGLCIIPTDPEAIRSEVDELAQAGKPVVILGRDIVGAQRRLYCGPTDASIGRAAAQACVEACPKGAKTVLLLHAGQNDPIYGPRYRSFAEELRLHPEITLLKEVDCGQMRADALGLVQETARRYARAGCWVFLEDWPYRALPAGVRPVNSNTRIVLCTSSPNYQRLVRNGQVYALITYDLAAATREALAAVITYARTRAPSLTTLREFPPQTITLETILPTNLPPAGE